MELVLIAVALIALAFVGYLVMQALAKRAIGPITMVLEPPHPVLGDVAEAVVRMRPTRSVRVSRVVATFTCDEWICWTENKIHTVKGRTETRTVTRTETHELFGDQSSLDLARSVSAGEGLEVRVPVRISADAPPSIDASNNKVRYAVNVHVEVPSSPDVTKRFGFSVPPLRRGEVA